MSEKPRFEKLAVVAKVRTTEQERHYEAVQARNGFLQDRSRPVPAAIYSTGPRRFARS